MSILKEGSKEALARYINFCSAYTDIDKDKAYNLAIHAMKYYNGDSGARANLRHFQELENRWYASLEANNPDYSVYDDKYFLSDLWACWCIYSRKYLLSIMSDKSLFNQSIVKYMTSQCQNKIEKVVDLGCGFGYTTAGLKEIFPVSDVYGTNIDTSVQFKVGTELSKKYNFSLVSDIHKVGKGVDLIFASEYFEHWEKPIDHLIEVVQASNPRFFLIANAFGTTSLGHFNKYKYNNCLYDGKAISKMFNITLKRLGYIKLKTKLWNNRPSFWQKRDTMIGMVNWQIIGPSALGLNG